MHMRVLVFGAAGRMGQAICAAVGADNGLELCAAVDPNIHNEKQSGNSFVAAETIEEIDPSTVDVAIDFTVAEAARENVAWCANNGVHAVVGTSGLNNDDHQLFGSLFSQSNCLFASNFAIGAVLMMRFAEISAPFFPTAEIIELHHDNKIDAPSGTAMQTLERMSSVSEEWGTDPTLNEIVAGARGGKGPGGISVHSVRLRGLVAHQEVILGTEGETLTIRHDSLDRSSFMGGILHACKVIGEFPGVTIGLDSYLGI